MELDPSILPFGKLIDCSQILRQLFASEVELPDSGAEAMLSRLQDVDLSGMRPTDDI